MGRWAVVLQKLMGVWEEAGELSLCGHPEQLVDDVVLGEDISFGHPPELAFAEHVHGFITLDGPLRRGKRSKPPTLGSPGVSQTGGSALSHYSNTYIASVDKSQGACLPVGGFRMLGDTPRSCRL
jgi:hypothetical protein